MNSPENILEYLSSPLDENFDLTNFYTPYKSKTDELIDEILAKEKLNDGSRELSPFTLLDSTVVIPPIIDDFKTAYYQEAFIYGDYIDLYIYENPIIKPKHVKSKRPGRLRQPKEKEDRSNEYRRRNSVKGLNKIRQLSLLNFSNENTKLLTLTFGDCNFDITNPHLCNKKLSKFLQDLRRIFPKYRYLGVLEFQQRGAVHYHILCDIPYLAKEELANLWGYGFIDIRKPDFLAVNYLTKYLEKSLFDERLKGVRVYFYSKNLEKPRKVTGIKAFSVASNVKSLDTMHQNQYVNKYNGGIVKYRQFKLPPAQKNTNV